MATTILTTLESVAFSYELQLIEISTDLEELNVALTADGSETIFSQNYTPDSSGTVRLFDLNVLTDAYIGTAPFASFTLTAGTASKTVKVLRSAVAYNLTASELLSGRFLTSSTIDRSTAEGRYECLSFYASAVVPVTADCVYWSDDTQSIVRSTVTVRAADYAAGSIVTIDVSPSRFDDLGLELAEYTIRCGQRSQRYRLVNAVDADPAIAFRNRFNVWDTFYFTGTKESDPQFDRKQAWINGRFLTYDVTETVQFTATTAPLPLGMEAYLEDIARSPEIRLLDSRGAMRDLLTVVDTGLKAINDDDALNVLTVTYRHADRISAKSFVETGAKIFDNSFDRSYE